MPNEEKVAIESKGLEPQKWPRSSVRKMRGAAIWGPKMVLK